MNSKVFTLNHNSESVKHLITHDKLLAQVIENVGTITYTLADDPYVFLVEHIVGQMLSNKVASIICNRLYDACGGTISPEAIENLSNEELLSIGISRPKTQYIRHLTEVVSNHEFDFEELQELPDEDVISKLITLRGVGKWTAKMYLIFYLNREDVLPFEDGAFLQAYKWLYNTDNTSGTSIEEKCLSWKPFSSIAARFLYKALDKGLTKK